MYIVQGGAPIHPRAEVSSRFEPTLSPCFLILINRTTEDEIHNQLLFNFRRSLRTHIRIAWLRISLTSWWHFTPSRHRTTQSLASTRHAFLALAFFNFGSVSASRCFNYNKSTLTNCCYGIQPKPKMVRLIFRVNGLRSSTVPPLIQIGSRPGTPLDRSASSPRTTWWSSLSTSRKTTGSAAVVIPRPTRQMALVVRNRTVQVPQVGR